MQERLDGGLAGVAQLVERKPSKLDVAGSSPVSRFGRERQSTTEYDRVRQSTTEGLGGMVVLT